MGINIKDDTLTAELSHEAQRITGLNGMSYIVHRGDMKVQWSDKGTSYPLLEFKPEEGVVVLSRLKKRDNRTLKGRLAMTGFHIEAAEEYGPLTIKISSLKQMQKLGDVVSSVLSPELKASMERR
jgi:hypothetical protein